MAFKDAPQCTAKAKNTGNRCKNVAMTGTTVCRLHGGAGVRHGADNPAFSHGRYAYSAQSKIAEHVAAVGQFDPLDVLDELNLQRGLMSEYIHRYDDGQPMPAGEVDRIIQWASEIIRSTEKIVRMRNETALTGAEVAYLQARAVDVAIKYFDNPATRRQFLNDLFGVSPEQQEQSRGIIGAGGEQD